MGFRENKKKQTRSELIEVAFALIEKQGYQQTTINEIADAVNISPRTFLRYFPTKDDVVVGWLDAIMETLPTTLSTATSSEPMVDALMRSAQEMLRSYQMQGPTCHKIEEIIATSKTLQARKQQRSEALVSEVSNVLSTVYGKQYDTLVLDIHAGVIVSLCRV